MGRVSAVFAVLVLSAVLIMPLAASAASPILVPAGTRVGTPAQGLIVSIVPPGIFGRDARIRVAFIRMTAADGRPLQLAPVVITAGRLRRVKDAGGAVASSGVGLILLGPVGLAAGALVPGGPVVIPPGAVAVAATATPVRVAAAAR
jgi:hypothetical protein